MKAVKSTLAALGSLALAAVPLRAQDGVDALLSNGRKLLAEGRPAEAQAVFEAAEKLDGATIKTRQWTLRSWLPQGRVNDTLTEIDGLDRKGVQGPPIDYLYGMAFAFKARGYQREGATGNELTMAWNDAVSFLANATKAEPNLYSDAFMFLAEAAWATQRLDVARPAAERAVGVAARDPEAWALFARIALRQFAERNGDEAQKEAADAHWNVAFAAAGRVVSLLAEKGEGADRARLAAARVELARCLAWKQRFDEVAREYGAAIALQPLGVDVSEAARLLPPDKFVTALEEASRTWSASHSAEDAGDATLRWWLGYAYFQEKKYAPAEEAFLAAVRKSPTIWNSWFYVAHARYQQQKFEAAAAALQAHWSANPADLVASIEANRAYNMAILEGIVGRLAAKGKNVEAASVTEMLLAAAPREHRLWNNLGLFYRDAGDQITRSRKPEAADKERAQALYEKALAAYEKSVGLAPEDPNYLNDLAVVLHYNLRRDFPRAKALYEKSLANATKELARTDLDADTREIRKIAARDSADNLEKLKREMEAEEAAKGQK